MRKFVEVYVTRKNATRENYLKIRRTLDSIGFLEDSCSSNTSKFRIPREWFVILDIVSSSDVDEKIILRIEYFCEPIGFPWWEGTIKEEIIKRYKFIKVKSTQ